MGDKTGISWTDATWNPIRGCSRVSEGCRNCYAESIAYRFSGPGQPYEGLVTIKNGQRQKQWNGNITFVDKVMDQPIRWKRPRRIFVNSMSDLFHPNVTDEMRDQIFAVMAIAKHHTFQILTKRPEIADEYLSDTMRLEKIYQWWHSYSGTPREAEDWPLPNVHIGVSVENIGAKHRIDRLKNVPAAVRFLSCEPLLEGLRMLNLHQIDWVIVGGESGTGARSFNVEWARDIVKQCAHAKVACFVKQFGAHPYSDDFAGALRRNPFNSEVASIHPILLGYTTLHLVGETQPRYIKYYKLNDKAGGDMAEWPEDLRVRQFPEDDRET